MNNTRYGHYYGYFALLIWLVFGSLAFQLIHSAPSVRMLSSVEIKPTPEGVVLGSEALGQVPGASSAELSHLWVGQDAKHQWLFKNVAVNRVVDAKTERMDTRYVRQWALQTGDILHFNEFSLVVVQADGNSLEMRDEAHNTVGRWDGSQLLLNGGQGFDACDSKHHVDQWKNRFKWAVKDVHSLHQEGLLLFSIGGQVHCTTRWPHAEWPPKAVRLYWDDDRYWVRADHNLRFMVERAGQKTAFQDLLLPVDGEDGQVTRLILGRTYYRVEPKENALTLVPTQNMTAFKVTENSITSSNPNTQTAIISHFDTFDWIGAAVLAEPWRPISCVVLALLSLVSFILMWFLRWDSLPTLSGGLMLWGTVAWHGQINMALAIFVMVGSLATLSWFLKQRLTQELGMVWLLFSVLATTGALTLTQLGAGADNSRWLRFSSEFLWLASAFFSLLLMVSGAPHGLMLKLWLKCCDSGSFFVKSLKAIGLSLLFLMLVAQLLLGSEKGIGGFQPVEIAKLMIVLLAAQALYDLRELRLRFSKSYLAQPLKHWRLTLQWLGVFALLACIFLAGVDDFSPLLIICVIMAIYLWQVIPHPTNPSYRQLFTRKAVFLLVTSVVIGYGIYFYQHPPAYESSLPQAERLRVWSDPYRYAEAAEQLLKGYERIAQGGLWGTGWFGSNGKVMAVPAIQNDFILVFVINRFGTVAALGLILVQLAWVTVLLNLNKQLIVLAQRSHFAKARCCYTTAFILLGLAALHVVHWLISWCNVLGLLPIMGQPFTWLSAGGSHLASIAFPSVLFALIAARLVNDDPA